jgi:GNAT superfamily N-acetyltransferase
MSLNVRVGRPEDAASCGRICFEAFKSISEQHNFPPDFPSAHVATGLLSGILSRPDVYSVVAEDSGRVLGSNFLWENSPVAGIGPITIDPVAQNRGVGRALMENVLERAERKGFASVRLCQAAYHGRSLSLYTKLGFNVREPLTTIQGPPLQQELPGHAVRVAAIQDVDACNLLCHRVHGYSRGQELSDAVQGGTATVVERGGRITGYATVIGFFGHAVAEGNDDLKALIAAAPSFAGPGFLLPSRNAEVFRWCLANGLKVVQPLSLMSIGFYNEPAGAFLPSILY